MKSTARKIVSILLIVCGALTLLGGTVFTIGMAAAGWDFTILNTVEYKYKTYETNGSPTEIVMEFETTDIAVYFDDTATQIRVEYPEAYNKKGKQISTVTVAEADGKLVLREETKGWESFIWNIGPSACASVYVPSGYLPSADGCALRLETDTGDVTLHGNAALRSLTIETDTGDLSLSELTAENLQIEVDTGDVTLNGKVTLTGALTIDTDTGDLKISDMVTAKTISLKTDTGEIYAKKMLTGEAIAIRTSTGDIECNGPLHGTSLILSTSTGDIEARIAGKNAEYAITVEQSTGSTNVHSNLESVTNATKSLKLKTGTGDIHVEFVIQPTNTL